MGDEKDDLEETEDAIEKAEDVEPVETAEEPVEPEEPEDEQPGVDEPEVEPEGEPEDDIPERPVFLGETEPPGKEDKAKYWILKEPAWTNKEIAENKGLNERTVSIARSHLADDGFIQRERQKPGGKQKALAEGAEPAAAPAKGIQIFAKGSPPEAIIESIRIPMVDGQHQGFEQGMKFGMSQLVLAVRIMQELSAIGLQQVKPLIDMTRSVREGEQAAFKGGADEGAMKAAQAMGATIMPIMSELQASIKDAGKGSETDPMKSMMVRTMEPLMKGMMKKIMPGEDTGPPAGFTVEEK